MGTSPVEGRWVHSQGDCREVSQQRVQKALRPFLIFNNMKNQLSYLQDAY